MSENIYKLFTSFVDDIIKVFPEYEKRLKTYYKDILENEKQDENPKMSEFLENIESISDKIVDQDITLFQEDPIILQNISFKLIWNSDISSQTKNNLWNYLRTFCMLKINLDSNGKISDVLKSIESKEKVKDKETLKNMKKLKKLNQEFDIKQIEKVVNENPESLSTGMDSIDKMFKDTDIGKIAKEITDDLDIEGIMKNGGGIEDIFNGGNMMNIIQSISSKMSEKEGELDTDNLMKEATNICGSMQENPIFSSILNMQGGLMGAMNPGNSNSNGGSNPDPTHVHSPEGFAVVSGKIFLADYNNDRVVVHNSLPTADGRSHDIVLGQPHLETELWASATSFSYPRGVASDGTALFVSDYNNNRVLVYSSIPSTANASADFVLGQADFISSVASTSQTALRNPRGLCVVGGKLYVVDYSAHRVLRYGLPITADNPNAEAVLGQENWTSRGSGNSNSAFDRPISCASDGTRFYVSMEGKDKVHMWNSIPVMSDETDNPSADVIIGTGSEGNASNQIRNPRGIFATTSSLIVADYQNHRVNIYNPLPTSDQPDLAYYLGVAASRNTINSLRYPSDFALSPSGRAYVLDGQNSRVMVFEGLTGAYSPAAVAVMGQENFETGTENPSLTKWSLGNNSEGMIYHKGRLIIADTDNRRVLIVPAK